MSAVRDYSLIVMTRNRPLPLARCLESIQRFRWDLPPPEIIVVDDGSNPPAREVTERFPSLAITTVCQEHSGVAAARNLGLKRSAGARVAFIADDYVLPADYLQDVETFFQENPDAEVITYHLDPRGPSILRPVQKLYFDLVIGQEVPPEEAGRDVVRSYTLPASRAAVFRREVFERVGMFDESLTVGEDGEFGRRMARFGIPVHLFVNKRVIHYDARTSLDYFRQRIRYGRSYIRVSAGVDDAIPKSISGQALLKVLFDKLGRKMRQWWEVSGRQHQRLRFITLSPFLVLFLCLFYYGAYLEFRASNKRSLGGRRQ